MQLFDFRNEGTSVGEITSTYTEATQISGVAFVARPNKRLTIGFANDETSSITPLIDYNELSNNSLPTIRNTATGTIFSALSSGGIVVKSGLITDWDMSATWNGSFYVSYGSSTIKITVRQGLISNVEQQ